MTQAMSKLKPLLPLEYCRLDRAARLLDCEECDLLHWGAIGAVGLWAHFDGYSCAGMVVDHAIENRTVTNGGNENLVNNLTSYLPIREITDAAFLAYLNGFWRISVASIKHMELGGLAKVSTYAIAKDEDKNTVFAVIGGGAINRLCGAEGSENPLYELRPSDLWIMRDGLELARQHIHSGQPFPKNTDEDESMAAQIAAAGEIPKPRTTANQSKAITELLVKHGYTDDDFRGSIGALQQKLSRDGLSGTLTKIDKNTLIAWLEKAGVR